MGVEVSAHSANGGASTYHYLYARVCPAAGATWMPSAIVTVPSAEKADFGGLNTSDKLQTVSCHILTLQGYHPPLCSAKRRRR